MPTSRMGCDAKVLGEEIFVVGGSPKGYDSISDTESYNPRTNKWTRRNSMKERRYAPAVSFENFILCLQDAGNLSFSFPGSRCRRLLICCGWIRGK